MTTDELIDCFEASYTVWILSYARAMLNRPDAGFAILMMLNPYPELVGKIVGRGGDDADAYQRGLFDIFPKIQSKPHAAQIAQHIRRRLRNGLAHASFTGLNLELTGNIHRPIIVIMADAALAKEEGEEIEAEEIYVRINPDFWFCWIEQHFVQFIERLRDPSQETLRKQFTKWMRAPMGNPRQKRAKKKGGSVPK